MYICCKPLFQINFQDIYSSPLTSQALTIRIGVNLDQLSPAILWQNGAGNYQSDLITLDAMINRPQFSWNLLNFFRANNSVINNYVTNSSLINSSITTTNSAKISVCQRPLSTSFCIDLKTLTSAMNSKGEIFVGDLIQTSSSISSFSCMQYCNSRLANVIILDFFKLFHF